MFVVAPFYWRDPVFLVTVLGLVLNVVNASLARWDLDVGVGIAAFSNNYCMRVVMFPASSVAAGTQALLRRWGV